MANITPQFHLCLKEKGAEPAVEVKYDLNKINAFLQEAYSIVSFPNLTNTTETILTTKRTPA